MLKISDIYRPNMIREDLAPGAISLMDAKGMLELKAAQPIYESGGDWPHLMRGIDADMRQLMLQLRAGMDPNVFWFKFDELLFDGHAGSHLIGQAQSGAVPNISWSKRIGREMADEEAHYLHGLVADLLNGRYVRDGEFDTFAVQRRMRLYQGKMRGTVAKGFTDASKADDEFVWVLGAVEDSCSDCPQLAALTAETPFTRDTIFQHPGDGNTPCLGNCKCHLVRVRDDQTSQLP